MENRLLSLKWNNHKTTFFNILKSLREKLSYTDATLAVEGKFYPVHKIVMSSCSDYFSEIFERTSCKSPVIVLKDVKQHDIEALLDYMYLGEVNVNQNSLASLLKTAECLKVKGLGSPEEDSKDATSSKDNYNWANPPAKRQRLDSNVTPGKHVTSPITSPENSASAIINSSKKPSLPLNLTPNIYTKENESQAMKVNNMVSSTEQAQPQAVKVETDCTEGYQTDQDEVIALKVKTEMTDEPERVSEREFNYDGGASCDRDPGEDYWSDVYETGYEPENYGDNFFPGTFMQQSDVDGAVGTNSDQDPYVADFEWTKESTLKFIEIYRGLPCLWQMKNHAYKDRNERRKGYIRIQKAFPNLSLNCVRKKINIIRTQYRREFRLYLLSKESGAEGDQIYKPRLWFFNHINFLSDGEMMTENTSSLD